MKRPSAERANARLRQLVGYVHARVDAEHAKPEKRGPPFETCTTGCASARRGCCSTIVIVGLAEAEYLVARQPAAVAAALPALREAHRRIRERISVDDVASMLGDDAARDRVAAAYHALDLPCPFLDAANQCGVYRDRPLACRTHFAASPPVECEASGVNTRHVTIDKGTRLSSQAWLIRAELAERRTMLTFGTLPQLVLEVAEPGRH